jgi:hypothetical protein
MLKIACHSIYKHPLPEGYHPIEDKHFLLPLQLLYNGACSGNRFLLKPS